MSLGRLFPPQALFGFRCNRFCIALGETLLGDYLALVASFPGAFASGQLPPLVFL
jgi:hypothetical protein